MSEYTVEKEFYPYPLYHLTLPGNYFEKNGLWEDDLNKITKLKADTYLMGLNSMSQIEIPNDRKYFVLPLGEVDYALDSKSFENDLHMVLNSYPKLEDVLIPYRKCLVHLFLKEGYFTYHSDIAKDFNEVMSEIRTLILRAVRRDMFFRTKPWTRDELKPQVEGTIISMVNDQYSDLLDDTKGLNNVNVAQGLSKKKSTTNVFVTLPNEDTCAAVLLSICFLLKGNGTKLGSKGRELGSEDNNGYMSLFPSKLSLIVSHLLSAITDDKVLKGKINPSEGFNDELDQICLGNDNCCDTCEQLCGSIPKTLNNMFEGLEFVENTSYESFIDSDILTLAMKAILHTKGEKDCKMYPLMAEKTESFHSIAHVVFEEKTLQQITFCSKLRVHVDKPMGIFLPNCELKHIVLAKICVSTNNDRKTYC